MKIGYVSDLHLEFKVPHFAVNDPQEPGDVCYWLVTSVLLA